MEFYNRKFVPKDSSTSRQVELEVDPIASELILKNKFNILMEQEYPNPDDGTQCDRLQQEAFKDAAENETSQKDHVHR